MQAGEHYGILPNMQPFEASRASSHLFGQLQNIPCVSQTRPNVSLLRENVPGLHLPLQHPREHLPRTHLHQYQGGLQNLQRESVNQALSIQRQHFIEVQASHQSIVEQLPPHSHSPEISSSIAAAPSPIQLNQFVTTPLGRNGFQDGLDRGASFNRWSIEETTTLAKLRSDINASFRDSGFRGPLWEEASRFNETARTKDSQLEDGDGSVHFDEKLNEMGYHRSAMSCKEKFENVQKYYKRTDGNKSRMQDGNHYRTLSELEAVCTENINGDDVDGGDSGGSSCGGVGGASIGKGHGGDAVELGGGSAATTGDVLIRKPDTNCSAVNLSSDSSEEEHAWSDEVDEQNSAKRRKRKSRSSPSRVFLETFTRQILWQQEALHKKLLNTIEKRDLERSTQEEAYRRQETARLNREQELRQQDLALTAARDAALLMFLEKASSQVFHLPNMITQTTLSNGTRSDVQVEAIEKIVGGAEINTKRWLKVEVRALIRLRSGMDRRFQEAGPKAHLWQEISASMTSMGFTRSPKRCKEKWENINKYFKKTKGSCRKRPENAKTCPYFHQLDTLYRRGILPSSGDMLNRIGNLSETMPENKTENAGLCPTDNSPTGILAIIPIQQSSPDSLQVTSSTAFKSHPDPERNPEADLGSVKALQSAIQSDTYSNQHPAAGQCSQVERVQLAVEGTSVINRKSAQMEMFVKDILELQQQQHQRLVHEYERMRQPLELRDFETQQMKQSVPASAQEHPHTNTVNTNNADLMALVHKLAEDSPDLTMSAPSRME